MARKTVQLRIYKGKEILLKADGKTPANENQKLTLTYDDTQWKNHLNNLKKTGICKIEIEAYFIGEKETDIPETLQKEIDSLLKTAQVELTPEQKSIADLQKQNQELNAKLEAFMNTGAKGIEVIKPVFTSDKETEFKTKVDLLLFNRFERVEDNFIKEDKTFSAERVYEISLEDLKNELNTSENKDLDLLNAQGRYLVVFKKEVPNKYKNNLAWILTELEK